MKRDAPDFDEMDDPSARTYDETNSVRFRWHIRDVQHLRPDLTDAEALRVLKKSWYKCDHSEMWDTMSHYAEAMFPYSQRPKPELPKTETPD